MDQYKDILLEVKDAVARITINRPEARNAVNGAVARGIDREGEPLPVEVDAVARALGSLAVRDLSVEDPPLEEVMGEFFARTRAR